MHMRLHVKHHKGEFLCVYNRYGFVMLFLCFLCNTFVRRFKSNIGFKKKKVLILSWPSLQLVSLGATAPLGPAIQKLSGHQTVQFFLSVPKVTESKITKKSVSSSFFSLLFSLISD